MHSVEDDELLLKTSYLLFVSVSQLELAVRVVSLSEQQQNQRQARPLVPKKEGGVRKNTHSRGRTGQGVEGR